MGKTKRVACIATPMLLTVASLICFLVVALAQVSSGIPNTLLQRDLYFFKVPIPCRQPYRSVQMDAERNIGKHERHDVEPPELAG
jgi:hypothetical protein